MTQPETGSRETEKQLADSTIAITTLDSKSSTRDVLQNVTSEVENELDDFDWVDGSVHTLNSESNVKEATINGVAVVFDVPPDPSKQRAVRRATAEEKELAELVHKANLLCLLGRGRLIDSACNDHLIQTSLLSLLSPHLLMLTDVPQLTAKTLAPLVSWLHSHFRVRGASHAEKSFHSALASTLESQEGTAEES